MLDNTNEIRLKLLEKLLIYEQPLAKDFDLTKQEFYDIVEQFQNDGLIQGVKFIPAGRGKSQRICYVDQARITFNGIKYLTEKENHESIYYKKAMEYLKIVTNVLSDINDKKKTTCEDYNISAQIFYDVIEAIQHVGLINGAILVPSGQKNKNRICYIDKANLTDYGKLYLFNHMD